jgi:hypothetical protein
MTEAVKMKPRLVANRSGFFAFPGRGGLSSVFDEVRMLIRFQGAACFGIHRLVAAYYEQSKGKGVMPTISMFYGILIRMFFRDIEKHHLPHIHADYQGKVAVYSILDGAVLAGELPPNKHKLVVAWIEIHQEDLLADWNLAVNGKKPFPIKGLDQ